MDFRCFRQLREDVAEVLVRLKFIGFRRFNQTVKIGACFCPRYRSAKEPILAANNKGPDCIFRRVVVDSQEAIFGVNREFAPVFIQVRHGFAEQAFWQGVV